MLYCIVFGLIFVIAGVFFFTGRAAAHIRGWREMPVEEQAKIRILPLCRNLSMAFFLAGAIFLTAGALPGFLESGFRWAMLAWMALCFLDLLYISKSGRYTTDDAGQVSRNPAAAKRRGSACSVNSSASRWWPTCTGANRKSWTAWRR